ncbi:MAG: hypothetical protein HOV87_21185 [Catenulispora sp.]|nr:hypothetical protein [Catenulispora sp.]
MDEPYVEHVSNVAATVGEALATDYDGVLRFAPALPAGWDASGTVAIQGGSKADVQVEGGTLATAAIRAGSTTTLTVRNPWPGRQAEVVDGATGASVVAATTAATFSVPVTAGSTYLVQQPSAPTSALPFAQVTGTAARSFRQLGSVSIGLGGNSLPPPSGNTVTVTNPGSQSGAVGTAVAPLQIQASDSAAGQTLTYSAAGLPPGLSISASGVISGTPTTGGGFTTTVTAKDTTGASGSATFTWSISGGGNTVTVTNPGSQSGAVGTPLSPLQIQASDSAAGQTLTYSAAGLPPGLSISASGVISGTPTTAGGFTTTVTAKDATGASGSATFDWSISGGNNGSFHVVYTRTSEWPGGFTASVTITNLTSTPVNGWTLAFSFPGDQKITNGWSATITQTGAAVTAANVSYNAAIPAGGSVQFGFQGTYTSNDSSPTAFTVNGIPSS